MQYSFYFFVKKYIDIMMRVRIIEILNNININKAVIAYLNKLGFSPAMLIKSMIHVII